MLLLKNGKIFTMDKEKIIYGDILIDDGKIKMIDSNISVSCEKEIDLKSSIVMPGLIDGHSSLGLVESGVGFCGNDLNEESDTISPQLNVCDGVNILDISFKEAIKAGVTSTLICPGPKGVVAGQCSMFKTHGKNIEEMCYKKTTALKVNLGEKVKNIYSSKVSMPRSRMGISYLIRKLFKETTEYMKKEISFSDYNDKYEALKNIILNNTPIIVSVDKAQDILTSLCLKDEFGLNLILQSCTEGHLVIDEIANRNVPVFLGPLLTDYSNRELINRNYSSQGLLSRKGITTCMTTSHPDVPIELLTLNAAISVRSGLDYEEGLKSITINPAKVLGISDKVGSISVGKDGDIVVFNGDPLKLKTKVLMTIVNGEIVYE